MINIFKTKEFFIIGFVANILNIIISLITFNLFALGGWVVAILYFPYDKLKTQKQKESKK